ncbi:MAG: MFS transporter [Bacilli bacterium]|nr:MFS transporter [Bacilli bacterium]
MKKKGIIFVLVLYFLYSISVNLVHPITVNYVTSLNLPDAYFGYFVSLMSLGQVVGGVLFGFLSDKIGRKWLVVLGIFGYTLAQFGFGFINENPILILLFRFLAGLFIAAPNTLFVSLCLDYSSESKKVKNLTLLSTCYILGNAFGYEIGGALYNYAKFSISQVFIFQIIYSLIISLLIAILIKDVYIPIKNINTSENITLTNNNKTKPIVYLLLVALMVITVAQILINKYLDTYIIHIGYEPAILGHYVFISCIVSAISNLLVIPFIKKIKDSKLAILLISFVAISAILTLITFSSKPHILIFLFTTHLIYIIIKGYITPLEQNELYLYTNETNKGKIVGIRQTILSIGNVFGPLIGSVVYTNGNPLIFIVAALIIILSLVLYIIYFALKKKQLPR